MSTDDSKFYDGSRLLTYNAVYNFVVGGRGIGKTFWFKRRSIQQFLKHGHEFIVLRRYSTELNTRHLFFGDVEPWFPDHEFRVYGMYGQIRRAPEPGSDSEPDWVNMCYFISLSTAQQKKSTPFAKVHTIIFDEFIIENESKAQYLSDEKSAFNNFYSTVDRFQDRVKVFFLANSVSIMAPLLNGYEILPNGKEFQIKHNGFIVAQFPDSDEFTDNVYKNTRFGRFIEGTEYAEYAVDNKFLDNHDMMLGIKDNRAVYLYTLLVKR